MKYYLAIDGMSGTSVASGYEGWFEVDSLSFGASMPVLPPAGGPIETGIAQFASLSLAFANLDGIATQLQALLAAAPLDAVRLVAVDDTPQRNVVFDMTLGGVFLDSIAGDSGRHSMSLQFQRIELATATRDASGVLRSDPVFLWDQAANAVGGPIGDPLVGDTVDGVMPQKYYLLIDGLDGGSTAVGHEGWFELDNFNWGSQLPVSIGSGVSGAPYFGGVSITLAGNTGLTELLSIKAGALTLDSMRIDGVVAADSGETTVYRLTLGEVGITSMQARATADAISNDLQLHYAKIGLETRDLAGDVTGSAFYNLVANDTSGSITEPAVGAGAPAATPQRYYLALDGIRGDAVEAGHTGWFEVVDIKLYDNSIDLQLQTETGLPALLGDLSTDALLGGATLQGTLADGRTVYNLDLGSVKIGTINEDQADGLLVSLSFQTMELSTQGLSDTDTLIPNTVFGWDFGSNAPTSVSETVPPSGGAVAGAAPTAWYMLVDGMRGGSTDAGHEGWFAIDGYDITAANAGTPYFSQLSVSIDGENSMVEMFRALSLATPLGGVRIEGVVAAEGGPEVVYRLTLSEVAVSSLQDSAEDGASLGYRASFEYNRIVAETLDPATGSTVDVHGWDIQLNEVYTGSTDLAALTTGGTAHAAVRYFLAMDGIAGDSVASGHADWLEVSVLSFGVAAVGGASYHGPLTLGLASDAALAPLLAAAISPAPGADAVLHGVDAAGNTVYTIELADAVVSGVSENSDAGFQLGLGYSAIEFTTNRYTAQGAFVASDTFGWDLAQNAQTTLNVAPDVTATAAIAPNRGFYMLIDGVNGGSTDSAHGGWFELIGLTFAEQTPMSGGIAGDPYFSSVQAYVPDGAGLTALLMRLATGSFVDGVVIEGMQATGSGVERPVYELSLGNVVVSGIQADSDGGYQVQLDFGQFALRTQSPAGNQLQQVGWDRENSQPFAGEILATPAGTAGNDILTGTRLDNQLLGLQGQDTLNGGGGKDTLNGGGGNDTLNGGGGNDVLVVGAGDVVLETPGGGIDTVQSTFSWTLGDNLERLELLGSGGDSGTGNALPNRITGNAGHNALGGLEGSDTLLGGGGNDTLDGGASIDTLQGGAGNDIYVVTAGDILVEGAAQGIDTVRSAGAWTLGDNLERLVLTAGASVEGTGNALDNVLGGNAGANLLSGLTGHDSLAGGGGDDTLKGSGGDDTLAGAAGNDVLAGGGGVDVFQFNAALSGSTNLDTVVDFVPGTDVLQLDDDVFTQFTVGVALGAPQFLAGAGVTTAQTTAQRILCDTNTGILYYDADGSATGAAPVPFALLTGKPLPGIADFVVVA